MRTIPLLLADATLTLYPADAEGNALRNSPVWIGARVEGFEAIASIEEVESTPSGAATREFEQGAESHLLRIKRIWAIPTDALRGFSPVRGRFVLEILHENRRAEVWHRFTYYGVTVREARFQSEGVMHYGEQQEFRAAWRTEESGRLPVTVLPQAVPNTPAILFIREDPLAAGNYLSGAYRFDRPVFLTTAYGVGNTSQGLATVLRLEQDGAATPHTLNLAAGTGEDDDNAILNRTVPAGAVLRWRVESAPPNNQANHVSVAVNLQQL